MALVAKVAARWSGCQVGPYRLGKVSPVTAGVKVCCLSDVFVQAWAVPRGCRGFCMAVLLILHPSRRRPPSEWLSSGDLIGFMIYLKFVFLTHAP